jgi:hypothetical protein
MLMMPVRNAGAFFLPLLLVHRKKPRVRFVLGAQLREKSTSSCGVHELSFNNVVQNLGAMLEIGEERSAKRGGSSGSAKSSYAHLKDKGVGEAHDTTIAI